MRRGLIFSFCFCCAVAVADSGNKAARTEPPALARSGFAVLELFTSQGCSSCPAADALLGRLIGADNPNVYALSFHVDYWNYLGWKDPFGKPSFSDRQRQYSGKLGATTYTPQLIINGQEVMVGSHQKNVTAGMTAALQSTPGTTLLAVKKVALAGGKLSVAITASSYDTESVLHVALVLKKSVTPVRRGENSGHSLVNYNVVTQFASAQMQPSNQVNFDFAKNLNPEDYEIIAFAQHRKSLRINGAARHQLN